MLVSCVVLGTLIASLNNGIGLTPSMGWTASKYCQSDQLNDDLVRKTVYKMSLLGLSMYEVILLGDCWMNEQRENNKLVPDPSRFPKGMPDMAHYIHNMGFLLGLSLSIGQSTSQGGPGSVGHYQVDADQVALWKADFIEMRNDNSDSANRDVGFPLMSYFINDTGRHVLFSCQWGHPSPYYMNQFCNLFQNVNQTATTWADVVRVIELQETRDIDGGPGGFSDAGPVGGLVDGSGLKSQLVIWSMIPSPLFITGDLDDDVIGLYGNKNLIGLNQDRLGLPSRVYRRDGHVSVWIRDLEGGRVAFLFINKSTNDIDTYGTVLNTGHSHEEYQVNEMWSGNLIGDISNGGPFTVSLNPRETFTIILSPIH